MRHVKHSPVVKVFWPSDLLDTIDSALILGWQNSPTDLFVIDLVSNIYVSTNTQWKQDLISSERRARTATGYRLLGDEVSNIEGDQILWRSTTLHSRIAQQVLQGPK